MRLRRLFDSLPVRVIAAVVVLVLFGGAGAGGAAIALSRTTPLYESTSALLFSPILSKTNSTAAFNAVNYISSRINAYVVIGQSATFQARVRAELPDGDSQKLSMTVVAASDSLLLNVSATDVSLKASSSAVGVFDRLLVSEVERLDGTEARGAPLRVDVVSGPSGLSAPVSPSLVTYYGIGVLGALALATGMLVSLRRASVAMRRPPGNLDASAWGGRSVRDPDPTADDEPVDEDWIPPVDARSVSARGFD